MDALTYLRNRTDSCAFHELLSMRLTHLSVGKVTLEMPPNIKSVNPGGTIHGGAIFSLCDIAAGTAALSHGRGCVTQSANITYLQAGDPTQTTVVTTTELHCGGRTAVYQVNVTNQPSNVTIATATMNMFFTKEPFPE